MPKCPQDPEFLVGSRGTLPFGLCKQLCNLCNLSPSSQAFLTKVWWGKLSVDNGLWRVITCMLFFPLLYTNLITFRYLWQLGQPCTEAGASSSLTLWLAGGRCRGISLSSPAHTSLPAPSREKRLQPMGCLARLRAFFTAPIVIFLMNILSYFTFLLLFAYVLMVDFQPTPSWREYLIYFWLFSLVCEETRQVRAGRAEVGGGRGGGMPLWVLLGAPTQPMSPCCSSCHLLF